MATRLDPQVLEIAIDRPEARNAMTFAMYERLAELARSTKDEIELRAVVLTGRGGKAFVSGTDIGEFQAFASDDDALAYEARMAAVGEALESIPVPAIAAISGSCVGGGFAIAAACDLRIATAASTFGFPIARGLGNCLSMTTLVSLVSLIGSARTTELIFKARLIEAEEARALGLIHEVVPDEAALRERTLELARTLASYAPLTLRATKEALRRIRQRLVPEGSDLMLMCYGSDDFKEGVAAFLAKRPARWTGR